MKAFYKTITSLLLPGSHSGFLIYIIFYFFKNDSYSPRMSKLIQITILNIVYHITQYLASNNLVVITQ